MFSAKFNFFIQAKANIETIASSGFMTLDYSYNAQPFVNVAGSGNSILVSKTVQCSLDYVYQGQPFYPNDLTFLNS